METTWVVLVTVLLANADAPKGTHTEYVVHAQTEIETDAKDRGQCQRFTEDLRALAMMEIVGQKFQMITRCTKRDNQPALHEVRTGPREALA